MKVNFDKSIFRLYFLLISSMLTKFLEGLLLVLTHGVAFWGAKMYLEKVYNGEWGIGIQFGSGLNLGYLHLINLWSLHRLFLSLPKLRSVFSLILLLITEILVWCRVYSYPRYRYYPIHHFMPKTNGGHLNMDFHWIWMLHNEVGV